RTLQLRAGAAATFNMQRLDMSALTMNAQNDPAFQNFAENFNKNIAVDFNIGIALSSTNFYVGYALQNASQGKLISKEDLFNRQGYFHHVAQVGFRKALSNRLGIVVSGLYRYDPTFLSTTEVQVKTILYNKVWIGMGYRSNMNTIGLIGFRAKQIQIGFAYELPVQHSSSANSGTSEFTVNYKFKTLKNKSNRRAISTKSKILTIW
ncbi:MAG: PorP/SprF family type IX secretion system membrane protein, partial [Chryseolinea sp.]